MPFKSRWGYLLLAPAVILVALFFIVPVVGILSRAFMDPEPGLATIQSLMVDETTWRVMWRTLRTGIAAVVICLILGYPYAYLMTLLGPTWQIIMMTVVLVPFWTSLMARTFAWISLLQRDGPVSSILAFFGLPNVTLLGTSAGVMIGITQILLPYMVLTLFASLQSIDRGLVRTAQSLGANRYGAFLQVYLPLSIPGILAASTLVFILALGFYITPQLLGSPQESLIAQVIGVRVDRMVDFAGAGGLSLILLVSVGSFLAIIWLILRPLLKKLRTTEGTIF